VANFIHRKDGIMSDSMSDESREIPCEKCGHVMKPLAEDLAEGKVFNCPSCGQEHSNLREKLDEIEHQLRQFEKKRIVL
jgi:DNA-directed RNA polymerase subunit M/transcription elongation factor TFIIS